MPGTPLHIQFAATAQTAAPAVDTGPGGGFIPQDTESVLVTSSSSAKFIILSDKYLPGSSVKIWVAANGFKLGTVAASTDLINNVDTSGGTASAAIPANTMSILDKTTAHAWLLRSITNLGAVATAIVPS